MLGDAGLNYYLDERDMKQKERLQRKINELKEEKIFVQILFVRGNHEARPSKLDTYKEKLFYDGSACVEEKYPDLIFLKDGERYTIEGKRFLVIGGGYSKDFFERVLRGYGYWYDEELSDGEFQEIADTIAEKQEKLYILSHMLPIKWSPDGAKGEDCETETRARRTEIWLQILADIIGINMIRWLAGHYHRDVVGERYEIVYNEIKRLE